jgi:hypothetical protein
MTLTIISLSIFLLYVGISLLVFKEIPTSLSNTYYMYKDIKDWLKYLFPIMMFSISGLLLPSWLDATEGSNLQFLSFLTCASIMFVGAAPNFKGVSIENRVHTISAIIAAICSMLWCIFVVGSWGIILGYLILILGLSLITKTLKTSYTFWLEMVAFLSLYTSLLIYNIVA